MNVRPVLVIRLADIDTARGAPAGASVRVDLGHERNLTMAQLARIASLVYGAANVQVEGHYPAAEDAAAYICRHATAWEAA